MFMRHPSGIVKEVWGLELEHRSGSEIKSGNVYTHTAHINASRKLLLTSRLVRTPFV